MTHPLLCSLEVEVVIVRTAEPVMLYVVLDIKSIIDGIFRI